MLATIALPVSDVGKAFDIRALGSLAFVLCDQADERVSLSDGMSRIGLRLIDGTLLDGPVGLRFVIDDARASPQLQTLARFRALRERGRFGAWLHRPEVRARRWILQLRAFDALCAGFGERDIARVLFGQQRTQDQWHDRDGSLRSAIRRLISTARHNVAGGYRDLLGGE